MPVIFALVILVLGLVAIIRCPATEIPQVLEAFGALAARQVRDQVVINLCSPHGFTAVGISGNDIPTLVLLALDHAPALWLTAR